MGWAGHYSVQLYKTVSSLPLAIFLNGSEPLSEGPNGGRGRNRTCGLQSMGLVSYLFSTLQYGASGGNRTHMRKTRPLNGFQARLVCHSGTEAKCGASGRTRTHTEESL